jgi:CheY-like chemotaxis protein
MLSEVRSPKLITLVEDTPSDVYLLRKALEEHGVDCTLEVIKDGEQAIRYLGRLAEGVETAPDLIVLDLSLPRYDGLEVLSACRQTSGMEGIPILVLTSSDSPREQARAEQLGISDYVRKPILLDDFMQVGLRIKQLLEPKARSFAS